MKKVCIFQDTENIHRTADLLEVAKRIYGPDKFESCAVITGESSDRLQGEFHHIIHVVEGSVHGYDPKGICDILETLHRVRRFDGILIPATHTGKMVAPRLAKRLGTGLMAGVTDIRTDDGRLQILRPVFSGKILEVIRHTGAGPMVMSIRPNAFEYTPGSRLPTVVSKYEGAVTTRSTVKRLHVKPDRQVHDIRDSQVLICGGNGVKKNFAKLYHLADALNGTVAASRKLVDQGIAPRDIQVGQSGKTVSPRLYIALGVHGTMQHISGLRRIESIISINTNSNAPICSLSDIVVLGDAAEFTDRLVEKITIERSGKKRS